MRIGVEDDLLKNGGLRAPAPLITLPTMVAHPLWTVSAAGAVSETLVDAVSSSGGGACVLTSSGNILTLVEFMHGDGGVLTPVLNQSVTLDPPVEGWTDTAGSSAYAGLQKRMVTSWTREEGLWAVRP